MSAAILAAGCDSQNSGEKVLRIGATGQSYPSSFKQDNKLVGFDVEVAETIAKDLNYKVEWVTADFSGLMGQLEASKLDTIANVVAITPARQENTVSPSRTATTAVRSSRIKTTPTSIRWMT